MWPFNRKKKLVTDKEALNVMKALSTKPRAVCTKGKGCVCEDCPKLLDCAIEMGVRRGGCSDIIASCSVKSFLLKNQPSDFADTIAAVKTRNVLKSYEEESDKLMKAFMTANKEGGNGKEAVCKEGTTEGDGPTVLG